MKKKTSKKEQKPMTHEMMSMANEKLMEHLQSMQFNSIEELNEYLEKNIMGKPIDEIFNVKKGRRTNIEKSDDLIYEAYETDGVKGLKLVREALKLNPDNVRALNYIADREKEPEIAAIIYKNAAALAAKQLGDNYIKRYKPHFWGYTETRPYMQARLGYATTLKAMGKHEEAIKELSDLLKLNPNDNQGVRYVLAPLLLAESKYSEFYKLHKKFDEESASWLYNYALFTFATEGPSEKANKILYDAYKANNHILKFLSGEKKFKCNFYSYYSPGDISEAEFYIMECFFAWVKHPDVSKWLYAFSMKQKKEN